MGIRLADVAELSVSDGSLRFEMETAQGSLLQDVRYFVDIYAGTFAPLTKSRWRLWKLLLGGALGGDVWHHYTFDDATYYEYSDKGLGLATGTYARATSTPAAKFGAAYLSVSADATIVTGWSSSAWTVMGWQYQSSAWVHVIETSAGDVFEDGVLQGSPSYGWSFSGGTLTVRAADEPDVDDLMLLPYALSESDVDDLISLSEAMGDQGGALYFVDTTGSLEELDEGSVLARPRWSEAQMQLQDIDEDGSLELARRASFTLREVPT